MRRGSDIEYVVFATDSQPCRFSMCQKESVITEYGVSIGTQRPLRIQLSGRNETRILSKP